MARTFGGVSDQIAFGSEAALDDLSPYTAMALVRTTGDVTDERILLSKFTSGYVGTIHLGATGGGGNNNKIYTYVAGSTPWYAESAVNALVANTWRVVVATWAGGVSVAPKLWACTLGDAIAELSYTGTPTGGTGRSSDASATLRIGARDAADAVFFSGGLAECALWNRVLTDDELRALGRGFTPAFFPRSRVFYCSIDGRTSTERNWAGTTHGTVSGAVYLEHPRVIYPSSNTGVKPSAAAAPLSGITRGIGRAIMRGIGRFR